MNQIVEEMESSTRQLTQSQLLIWVGQMLSPDAPLYNMAMTFEFESNIDEIHFSNAFEILVEQSDILRTVMDVENDIPQQKVLEKLTTPLTILDFSNETDPATFLEDWAVKRSQKLFSLAQPLFDSVLIKIKTDKYIWYFNQHHLITDGWSLALLYNTLSKLYGHTVEGTLAETTALPSYFDFIQYEDRIRSRFQNDETLKKNWATKGDNLPTPPRLYGQSPANPSSASERVSITLGKDRTAKLRALTQEPHFRMWTQHLSLYNMFATLLFAFIHRISGQHKLAIGSISHNRTSATFKKTAGLFMEVYPLMLRVEKEDSFLSLFERVKIEAFELLKQAQPGMMTPALSKQFNVVLNYINAAFDNFNGQPVQSNWIHPEHSDPRHHIRLQVHDFDDAGNIKLHFDLNCDTFDDELRAVIPTHFVNLLDHFIEDYSQSINACAFITAKEEQQLLADFNDTETAYQSTDTLVSLFEQQVKQTPESIALVFEGKTMTYASLNKKANQLARFLRAQTINEEKIIAVCMERSMEMVIALYGIIKAGYAYLPISPYDPKNRLEFVLNNANATVVLTQQHLNSLVAGVVNKTIHLDTNWAKIADYDDKNLPEEVLNPKTTAYTIYTSGSTGQPKGVLVPHEGICNRLRWIQALHPLTTADKILQKTPYTFDVSVWEFFWPLQQGATLVIARPEGHKDDCYLVDTVNEYGITVMHFVPSMLSLFLENKNASTCQSLRQVHSSGEALSMDLQQRFFEHLDADLLNLYGPTEASVDVSYWKCDKNSPLDFVPIGRPVANTQLYILDEQLKVVPKGVTGELHIGGIQLAKGYLNQPKLTAERFITNPFDKKSTSTLYKTGDLARYCDDGVIQYLGRLDHQIKLRGFRIELGEIEAALQQHPDIQQAVVLLKGADEINQQLVAFFTVNQAIETKTLHQYLAASLPHYMLPAQFIEVDTFMQSSSGKVNRKALLAMDIQTTTDTKNFIAARTEIEEILTEIWEEVLQIEKIGVFDNFIDLGGHSLLAIRLIARINNEFELELPLNLIFIKTTIASLGEHIETTMLALLAEMDASNTDF